MPEMVIFTARSILPYFGFNEKPTYSEWLLGPKNKIGKLTFGKDFLTFFGQNRWNYDVLKAKLSDILSVENRVQIMGL